MLNCCKMLSQIVGNCKITIGEHKLLKFVQTLTNKCTEFFVVRGTLFPHPSTPHKISSNHNQNKLFGFSFFIKQFFISNRSSLGKIKKISKWYSIKVNFIFHYRLTP